MPLHDKFGLSATSRASFYLYNTREEVGLVGARLGKSHTDIWLGDVDQ